MNRHVGYATFFRAISLSEQNRPADASKDFQRALRTIAHRSQPLRELAACEEKTGNRAAAAQHLAEALAIEPVSPSGAPTPRAELGRLLLGLNRWADGTAQFRAAVADAPASRVPFDGLATAYEYFGIPEPAVAAAFALLGSPKLATRACEHLARLSASFASQKPFIIASLRQTQNTMPAPHPAVDNLLKDLTSNR